MTAVDHAFLRDFADRWLAAWNSRDTDEVLALVHPDVRWDEQVFWPRPLHGREEVRGYVDAIWRAMPAYEVSETQLFTAVDDGRALVLFTQRGEAPAGLPTARPGPLGADGGRRRFEVQGCDIFLGFSDGLLSDYTAAYEIGEMLRQLGALPPRGSMKGGSYLLSLAAQRPAAALEESV